MWNVYNLSTFINFILKILKFYLKKLKNNNRLLSNKLFNL